MQKQQEEWEREGYAERVGDLSRQRPWAVEVDGKSKQRGWKEEEAERVGAHKDLQPLTQCCFLPTGCVVVVGGCSTLERGGRRGGCEG